MVKNIALIMSMLFTPILVEAASCKTLVPNNRGFEQPLGSLNSNNWWITGDDGYADRIANISLSGSYLGMAAMYVDTNSCSDGMDYSCCSDANCSNCDSETCSWCYDPGAISCETHSGALTTQLTASDFSDTNGNITFDYIVFNGTSVLIDIVTRDISGSIITSNLTITLHGSDGIKQTKSIELRRMIKLNLLSDKTWADVDKVYLSFRPSGNYFYIDNFR